MDLRNLIDHLCLRDNIKAIGTSLGAAILWSYSELFTTRAFSHMVFVDQAPLQNYLEDWGPEFGNLGCNSSEALHTMQKSLIESPRDAHLGTIAACLGYRSHPQPGDPTPGTIEWEDDEAFFLTEASKGNGWWYGKLMADHTANDWRHPIAQSFGTGTGSKTRVLVMASSRSGCFPPAGPLKVVELINGGKIYGLAEGMTIDWGGHWCYWEEPSLFNAYVHDFFD
jgi:pimeloyl-ACP methyl ester carboxylesterase